MDFRARLESATPALCIFSMLFSCTESVFRRLSRGHSLFCAVKSSAGVLRDFSGAAALCRTASLVKFVNERTRLGERSQNK